MFTSIIKEKLSCNRQFLFISVYVKKLDIDLSIVIIAHLCTILTTAVQMNDWTNDFVKYFRKVPNVSVFPFLYRVNRVRLTTNDDTVKTT